MKVLLVYFSKIFIIITLAIGLIGFTPQNAFSQTSISGSVVEQRDLNSDGRPELTIIETAFATDRDQILVYDQANNMLTSSDVATAVDFRDDAWIFDTGMNGDAQLIILFGVEGQNQVARIYDDIDGDGKVAYKVSGTSVTVTESTNWHVKVISEQSWVLANGKINPEVEVLVDGYVLRYLAWAELYPTGKWGIDHLKTDGIVDWRIQVVDSDKNGVADFQIQRLLSYIPWYYSVFRSTLYVNQDTKFPTSYPDSIFWPFLVGSHNYEKYNYFDHPPVIAVKWDSAKIDRVGILGYPTENGYHINSRVGVWQDNQTNYADFENPMAYYDLAGDKDGKPELFVRFEVFGANDPLFLFGRSIGKFPKPVTQVEYTWDQNNDGKWDFELGLGGFIPITTTTSFGDLRVLTVPYNDVVYWTSEQKWNMAVLVAAESDAYWNSEGMGEWSIDRGFINGALVEPSGLRNLYLTGIMDQPPLENYSSIRVGMRGELSYNYNEHPFVYQSVVDGKLHLLRAQQGVWQISDKAQLRYANLNNDDFLDQWQFWENGSLKQQVVDTGRFLLYSDEEKIILLPFNHNPAKLVIPPPRSLIEWQVLEHSLQNKQSHTDPCDLLSIMKTFTGSDQEVVGVKMRDYRMTKDGFRFLLTLNSGYVIQGSDSLDLSSRVPGNYIVSYDGSTFHVQPLTPPDLGISIPVSVSSEDLSVQYVRQDFQAVLRNTGLEDAQTVEIRAEFQDPGQKIISAAPQTVSVLAGESLPVRIPWAPTAPGTWQVRVTAQVMNEQGQGGNLFSAVLPVQVAPAPQITAWSALSAFGLVPAWAVLLLLASITAIAGALVWSLLRGSPS